MSNIEFRLVAIQDGKEVLIEPLSYELLANLVSYYPDSTKGQALFGLASQHPSAEVRMQVANKNKIDEETCHRLTTDDALIVLKNLVSNAIFKEVATLEILEKYLTIDKELAEAIAYDLECYKSVDILILAELIASNKDPSVVAALANNRRAPKKVLRDLLSYPDPLVVERAGESLK
jgi:uncharacterized protein YejL (UPF0352 family)